MARSQELAWALEDLDDDTRFMLRALGEFVLELRTGAMLTQRGLADRSGVSQSTISRVERGLAPGFPFRSLARLIVGLDRGLVMPGLEPWLSRGEPSWRALARRAVGRGRTEAAQQAAAARREADERRAQASVYRRAVVRERHRLAGGG